MVAQQRMAANASRIGADVASRTIRRFAPSNNLPGPLGDRSMGRGLMNGLQFFLKRIFVEGLQVDIKTSSSNSNSFHA
jgi:hypothetical protein